MLKQRVITALVLMALLLPSLMAHALWPFTLFSLVFIGAAGWEWSRLNDAPGWKSWVMALAVAGVGMGLADRLGLPLWHTAQLGAETTASATGAPAIPAMVWGLAALWWLPGGAWALKFGGVHWRALAPALRALLGLGILVLAWLALTEAKQQGLNFLLSVLCLVWAADIGAYFGGRAFGHRKLAPSISPGKSWEGVAAGVAATLLLAVLWITADRQAGLSSVSFYSRLLQAFGVPGLVLSVVALTGMSVVGDLFESLIKRQAGQKDSSQLLPGHGGVLDRIDALLPVLPLSMGLMALGHV